MRADFSVCAVTGIHVVGDDLHVGEDVAGHVASPPELHAHVAVGARERAVARHEHGVGLALKRLDVAQVDLHGQAGLIDGEVHAGLHDLAVGVGAQNRRHADVFEDRCR